MAVTIDDWYDLKSKSPEYLHTILDLCIEFVEEIPNVRAVGEGVDETEIGTLFRIFESILEEYQAIIASQRYNDKTEMEKLRKDIRSHFSAFYDPSGQRKNVMQTIHSGNKRLMSENIITQVMPFIESRIYYSLNQVYESLLSKKNLLDKYATMALYKTGGHPLPEKEQEKLDDLMKGTDSFGSEEKGESESKSQGKNKK